MIEFEAAVRDGALILTDGGIETRIMFETMWGLREDFGLRVLGGCRGTDDRHVRALGARMAGSAGR